MVNIIILQDKLGLVKISEKSKRFRDKWMNLLDYINEQTKSIKKVQNDCELLQLCALSTDDKVFKGFVNCEGEEKIQQFKSTETQLL